MERVSLTYVARNLTMKKIAIIGPGAVGTLLASDLQKLASLSVHGPKGPVAIDAWIEGGVREHVKIEKASVSGYVESDMVFVTTKAYHLETVLPKILPELKPGTIVVILCNGYIESFVENYAKKFPDIRWRLGSVTYGIRPILSETPKPPNLRHRFITSSEGNIFVGPYLKADKKSELEKKVYMTSSLLTWSDNISIERQKKWLMNVTINTLAAVHRLKTNGDLLKLRTEVDRIFGEAWELAAELYEPWKLPKKRLHEQLYTLIEATRDNENSMARDLRLNRPLEIAFLSGLASERYPDIRCLHEKLITMSKNN